ncbi:MULTISPECIES: RidA family protein [Paraburkholderia]|uniref:RidA family protein n=1 Tax=Paraburkholderia TaxID=1822464 RepID=UPI001AFDB6E1|nr:MULTISPECIES: RidA family protein [Paraburkholderia]MCX4136758.1 RidA family protein [Paraburkholderia aspalathi]MCX4152628.1 RidA family protein [Paraburkholderia aspalathi]MDN7162043.1 RidA family protein [Paraburkholderia sp. SECH2]MDN7169450.1 RidA family protein [Paraburkholderia sp. SEWSISQ10-3 4]MDQ6390529.1 RidA family protein [Paraburkholderia aspalathi]
MNRAELDARLAELGIELQPPKAAIANYVPTVLADSFLHISGQVAFKDGKPFALGQVGQEVSIEQAKEAARLSGMAILSQLRSQLTDDLSVIRVCSVTGYVHAATEFTEHPEVINGASEVLVEVLGEKGRHSRAAVGVSSLPFRCPVEVSAVIQLGKR